jgi:hypothetical protein
MQAMLPVATVRCPVCGASVGDAPWRCARCDTPHHADCAEYFGGCAVFACRDGHLPTTLEVASWPESLRVLDELSTLQRHKVRAFGALIGSSLLALAALIGPVPAWVPVELLPWTWALVMISFASGAGLHSRAQRVREGLTSDVEDVERTLVAFRRARGQLPARLPRSRLWALVRIEVILLAALALIPLEIFAFQAQLVWLGALIVFGGMYGLFSLLSLNALLDGQEQLDFLVRAIEGRTQPVAQLEAKPGAPPK